MAKPLKSSKMRLLRQNCEKLEEDKYVKEQTVKIRVGQLQNNNIKLQEEYFKNNNLH